MRHMFGSKVHRLSKQFENTCAALNPRYDPLDLLLLSSVKLISDKVNLKQHPHETVNHMTRLNVSFKQIFVPFKCNLWKSELYSFMTSIIGFGEDLVHLMGLATICSVQ